MPIVKNEDMRLDETSNLPINLGLLDNDEETSNVPFKLVLQDKDELELRVFVPIPIHKIGILE